MSQQERWVNDDGGTFSPSHVIHRRGVRPATVSLNVVTGQAPQRRETVPLFQFDGEVWRYRSGRPVDGVVERVYGGAEREAALRSLDEYEFRDGNAELR